jgi:hypothetical protein
MNELVLPSKIPWKQIQGKDLEELLYWLLDDMGAKDLEWRIGGSGEGAADQGRDLEAFFYMSGPDGEMIRQRWWVQAKGRSRTVEPNSVRDAITTTSAFQDIDVILIVTNSHFSNPTRDWVKQWVKTNPNIVVKLWDQNDLEKLVCKHPSVISRLYAEALSLQGKLDVIRSQFWNHSFYPGTPMLSELWENRDSLEWNRMSMIAIIAGEAANGDFANRPWPLILSNEELAETFILSIVNTIPFAYRQEMAGINPNNYIKAVSYLVLSALDRLGSKVVSKLLENCWEAAGFPDYPKEVKLFSINPILGWLRDEIFDVCVNDCLRVSADPSVLDKDSIKNYWLRLKMPKKDDEEDETIKGILIFEKFDSPCNVGFKVNKRRHCPLRSGEFEKLDDLDANQKQIDTYSILTTLEKVIRYGKEKIEKRLKM